MKETAETVPSEHSAGAQEFTNRRLVRPSLPQAGGGLTAHGGERRHGGGGFQKRSAPSEQTNAENFYYQKQMQTKTPMVVVLHDGERIQGVIEWYDRSCIKVMRENGQTNVLIYKGAIKYMYKESEGAR